MILTGKNNGEVDCSSCTDDTQPIANLPRVLPLDSASDRVTNSYLFRRPTPNFRYILKLVGV